MKEYIVQAIAQETIDSFDAHDAPELVRCKDCKHGHKYEFCVKCENVGNPGMFATYHRFDWFCADGERK